MIELDVVLSVGLVVAVLFPSTLSSQTSFSIFKRFLQVVTSVKLSWV